MTRREDLEAAIEGNPYDERAYLVLADHLMEIGDPRGQLIALQLASRSGAMTHTAAEYFEEHRAVFAPPDDVEFGWACGYARSATIHNATVDLVRATLDHPSTRFLTELKLHHSMGEDPDAPNLVGVIAETEHPSLRVLHLTSHRGTPFAVDELWPAVPRIVELELYDDYGVLTTLNAPSLARLRVWPLPMLGRTLRTIAAATLPELTWLSLSFSSSDLDDHGALEQLLATDFPVLRRLEIVGCPFADELVAMLASSRVLPRLESLDLHDNELHDEGARVVQENATAFRHLTSLNLSGNWLTEEGIAAVQGIARSVETHNQTILF